MAISERASDAHAYMQVATIFLSISYFGSKPTPSCTETLAATGRQVLVYKLRRTTCVVCTPS